jgi:Tfp pilus assembly protein PilF
MLKHFVLLISFLMWDGCAVANSVQQETPQPRAKKNNSQPNPSNIHNYSSSTGALGLYQAGKYQEAMQSFLQIAKDPQSPEVAFAYEKAGLCALKIDDAPRAVEYFYLALAYDPKRVIAQNELSKLGWNKHAKEMNAYFP